MGGVPEIPRDQLRAIFRSRSRTRYVSVEAQADLTRDALEQELTMDPAGIGYNGNTENDHMLINQFSESIQIDREEVPTWEVLAATTESDFGNLASLGGQELDRYKVLVSAGTIDLRAQNIRGALVKMFGPGTETRDNMIAISTRDGSRSEELWATSTPMWMIRDIYGE